MVRTDPKAAHKGFTFMYVPARLPGTSYTVYKDMGRMGLSTGGFTYKDVVVPEYCVLGEVNTIVIKPLMKSEGISTGKGICSSGSPMTRRRSLS
jgi:alkylation response protein AidB-like acyl-CoA dehydrogenase